MTLHVVLGDGYLPTKELTAHLQNLSDQAAADRVDFWLLLQAKPEPTDTDRALIKWLNDNDVYFDVLGDKESADKAYAKGVVAHRANRLAPKVVELMERSKAGWTDEDGNDSGPEDADLLALFYSDEEDADEDSWLNDTISAVADHGFLVYALNDGMTLIEPPDEDEGEDEGEEGVAPSVEAEAPVSYTRDELSDMDIDELKKIAAEKGVTVAPRSRRPTYIDAILGEEETEVPEAEIEAPPKSNITPIPTGYNTGTMASATFLATELSGPAMIIVVYDGTVTSRVMTVAQAKALLSS